MNHLGFIPDIKTVTASNGRRICTLSTVREHLAVNAFLLVPKTELTLILNLKYMACNLSDFQIWK